MTVNDKARDLLRTSLSGYQSCQITLGRLIEDVDAIWQDAAPGAWRDEVRGHWWTLEQVYASALDQGVADALPVDFVAILTEPLDGLAALATARDHH
jgi:hypothetical protein